MHTFISNNISAAILKYSLRESSDMRQKLHLTPFTFLVIDFAEPSSYKALCAWIKDVRHHLILFKWGFPEAFIPGSPPCLEYRSNRSSIGNLCDQLVSLSISHLPTTNKHRARLVKGGDQFKKRIKIKKNYSAQKLSFELWLYATLFLIKGNQRKCRGDDANDDLI